MRQVFTLAALQGRTVAELSALFAQAQRELVCSDQGSPERRAALANLDTISRVLAHRMRSGP